jgi:soluble lytic murein transglycosylase
LAAYNAGGGSAARWASMANGDPDLFYELVDFEETRLYIRLVSQNYAIYNLLFRRVAYPALPYP